jgi:plasmid stability protein
VSAELPTSNGKPEYSLIRVLALDQDRRHVINDIMATILIRNFDDKLKQRLRVRAAEHGRSMEAEARDILVHGVSASTSGKERSAAGSIRGRWAGRFQTDEILKMTRGD